MTSAERDDVVRAVSGLLTVLPMQAQGGQANAKLALAAYVTVLEAFPIWAINKICRAYLDGTISNGGFAPSPPEIATECRLAVSRFAQERANLETILEADVFDDQDGTIRSHAASEAIAEAAKTRAVDHWHKHVRPHLQPTAPAAAVDPEESLVRLKERLKTEPLAIGERLAAKLAEG